MTIWNKYEIINIVESYKNFKTYLTKFQPIIKEIIPNNENEYDLIIQNLNNIKDSIKIYDIIEENKKIYIVIDNDKEILLKIDKLLFKKNNVITEAIIKGHSNPISKEEVDELFKMENAMCKITQNNKIGTGFFYKFNNFEIKYGLFTNNHILNENDIQLGKYVHFRYLSQPKRIKIDNNRRVYTNEELDYTCIEILENDNIEGYFEIYPEINKIKELLKYGRPKIGEESGDIFILQYPGGNDLSFSSGQIFSENDKIMHSASTEGGSSGSPIIRRYKDNYDNYIIGLHLGFDRTKKLNMWTTFDEIYNDINKKEKNEINCIYNKQEEKIRLFHDYDNDYIRDKELELYLEGKKNINEANIEIYINNNKINFNTHYNSNERGEIQVKFKFKRFASSTNHMFSQCYSLKSIDLSSFYTTNINDMSNMFDN